MSDTTTVENAIPPKKMGVTWGEHTSDDNCIPIKKVGDKQSADTVAPVPCVEAQTGVHQDNKEVIDILIAEAEEKNRREGIPDTTNTLQPEVMVYDEDGPSHHAEPEPEPCYGSYLEMIKTGRNIEIFSTEKPIEQKEKAIDFFVTANDLKPVIFRQGTQPVHIFSDGKKAIIEPISRKAIVTEMYKYVDYIRVTTNENKPAFFPQPLSDMIINDLDLIKHLPPIVGIENRPYILKDGTIITRNGYDSNTKKYLNNVHKIRDDELIWFASHDEAKEAFQEAIEPLSEFGYHSDIDHQNAVAMLFSIAMQTIIDAPIPMFMITKLSKSYGGTLLLETMFHYFDEPYNSKKFPYTNSECIEVFSNCDSLKIRAFDDLPDRLRISHQVQQVATSGIFSYTPKYSNDERTVKVSAVLIGTGKQVKMVSEQAKRSVEINLSKKDIGRKRTREGNESQLKFVDANQRRNEIRMLSLIRYWIVNGSRLASDKVPKKESFDRWRSVIGGFLEFLEFGDLFLHEDNTRETGLDEEIVTDKELLGELYAVFDGREFVAAEVIDAQRDRIELKDILARLLTGSLNEKSEITKLGNKLSSLANRSDVDGHYQIIRSKSGSNHSRYQVVKKTVDFQTAIDDRQKDSGGDRHHTECTCSLCTQKET